jgi:hypothetical protein
MISSPGAGNTPPAEQAPVTADPLVQVLVNPAAAAGWTGAQWSQVFRKARLSGLTGRLASRLLDPAAAASSPPYPEPLHKHLEAAQRVCQAQRGEVVRELRRLDTALATLEAPVIVLKGAAYAIGDLPAANGRVFSDIDILVPKTHLGRAEALLTLHGWMTTEESDYNQRYYRQWMHELPPMRHVQRGTVVDLHHSILPATAKLKPDARKLIASAHPLQGSRVLHVLQPVDMLLHSMAHLFMNDDMSHALRDLSDLQLLTADLRHEDPLWAALVPRAAELDLGRPLYYALQQLNCVLQVHVPAGTWAGAQAFAPGRSLGAVMRWIWSQTFTVPLSPDATRARDLALSALYVRGHWLRMPPGLLTRHLATKALGLHKNQSGDKSGNARDKGLPG